jgi:predicted restriction endonuclease
MHARNLEIVKLAKHIGRTSSALAMKLTNIASLDPAITSTGRTGLQGASAADKSMWEEMHSDWERFAVESQYALASFGASNGNGDASSEVSALDEYPDYTGSNKIGQTKIRVGQNFFRRSVLSAYDTRCCITGLSVPKLLVASHIVPWRVDAANRLNPRNGLCLSMLHDRAFDAGIISLADDLTVCVSRKHVSKADPFFSVALLAYDGRPIAIPTKFRPLASFLAYHREHVFGS